MHAVDDGIWSGNFNAADVMFLIAMILFVVETVLVIAKQPRAGILVPLGLAFVAFGWLLL